MIAEHVLASRLAIAALVGLASGLEREWSGHATGADARFAGIRTFTLLGMIGGACGILASESFVALGGALALAAGGLCVAGYAAATRRSGAATDGTTEAAALVVIALGAIAGVGGMAVAAGAGAILVLLLREKDRVHWFVAKLDEPELRAGVQFVVLAVVVLPLLPAGPFFQALEVKPRSLWAIVLFFSALNFAGFIARRSVGVGRGFTVVGALGGVFSSTALTLNFSRQSRESGAVGAWLASGVIAACTVLVPRVLLVSAFLNLSVALHLVVALAPMFVVGAAMVLFGGRSRSGEASVRLAVGEESPLQLTVAIRMTLLFQAAMLLVAFVRRFQNDLGLAASGAVLGLTDVDALTVSLSRAEALIPSDIAARAILIGIVANTVLKMMIAMLVGRAAFRRRATAQLTMLALAGASGLLLM